LNESNKTVLIVDDEAFVRQSFADYFEDRLWCPLQAESAEQALKILETHSVHGAVVDIRLKGMDGESFIRAVSPKHQVTAFAICTGSPEYRLPHDLAQRPNICGRLFRKPVGDMADIESNLLRLIATFEAKKNQFNGN